MHCDQCEAAMIQGVFCHESGCPNTRKTWIPERESWVKFVRCFECGDDIEVGESCTCGEESQLERIDRLIAEESE